jgi:phosphoadenosine phosphosulfate reductase
MTKLERTPALVQELDELNQRFERSAPREILEWTFERFDDDVAMACSFEDLALLHMVHALRPRTEIIFLDTGDHFAETIEFCQRVSTEWSLRITTTRPGDEAQAWPCGTDRCCELRKVAPLAQALRSRSAWITAAKRVDASSRTTMKTLMWDEKFGLVKVNPLALWSDDDVVYYLNEHDLELHPLWAEGYTSIGCATTTLKPQVAGERRSGRWAGRDKEECGLHLD